MKQESVYCACGCGAEIPWKPHHKYRPAKYLRGHIGRVKPTNSVTPEPGQIPDGLCECGCGRKTEIAKVTEQKRRHFRGHPLPFLPGHSPRKQGPDHHLWKGGRSMRHGYVILRLPDHPLADVNGCVPEHRVIACEMEGRILTPNEAVHHINGIKDDNRPENLVVLTHAEHRAAHAESHGEIMREYHKNNPDFASDIGKKGAASRWS